MTSMVQSNFKLETIIAALQNEFGERLGEFTTPFDLLTVEVQADAAYDVIAWLKNHELFQIQFLTNIAGVHFPEKKGEEIQVVYHLHSLQNNFRIRLKANLPIENPSIRSIVSIYDGANWLERETYDFYGIIFEGHPNLCRILNEDSMDYFPLRKEYQLEDGTRQDKDNRFFGR